MTIHKLGIAILISSLLWPFTAHSKEWSDHEKQLFAAYAGLTLIDVAQSYSAMRDPCNCYEEGNPIFGSYVSNEELILASTVSMYAMHRLIEKDAPDWMLYTMIGLRGAVVINNHSIGVRINFNY